MRPLSQSPTVAQAKAKLEKLNDQADAVVEKYNQAAEKWKKAKKKYETLSEAHPPG